MPRYVRHKKRGTVYKIIDGGFIQTDRPLKDYDRVVIYRSTHAPDDEELVVRPVSEMWDGRFEDLGWRWEPDFWLLLAMAVSLLGFVLLLST